MDCSITPLDSLQTGTDDLVLVSTIDFFFPLVDDPYMMGRIGAANVLSDLYAQGVVQCSNLLMVLAVCRSMAIEERRIVTAEMVQGFRDVAIEAGSLVTGGQTVLNPWPIIGGVAQSVSRRDKVLLPHGAVTGDVLVLTKPLGTQLAVNLYQWMLDEEESGEQGRWAQLSQRGLTSSARTKRAYDVATWSMERLNQRAASEMIRIGAHAATDVTGFGLLGHAKNLVANQRNAVSFVVDRLPIIAGMAAVDQACSNGELFKLRTGYSAETSGGLLVAMTGSNARTFCERLEEVEGWRAFVIGRVVEGNRDVQLSESLEVVEVD